MAKKIKVEASPLNATPDSTPLVERCLNAAMSVAMFDFQYNDETTPEIASIRGEMRDKLKAVLGDRR